MRWFLAVTALGLAALATACGGGKESDLKTFLAGPTPLSREAALEKLRTMVEGAGNYYAFGCISWPDAELDICHTGLAPGDLDRVAAGLPLSTDGIWAANGHERLWSPADLDCGYGGTNQPKHPHLLALYDVRHPGHVANFQQVELDGRTCLVPQ